MSAQTPTPASPPASPDSLARQLRLFQGLAAILLLLLAAGGGFFWYQRHQGQPVTILADGKPVATVRNVAAAQRLLTEAEQAKTGSAYSPGSIIRLTKVRFQTVAPSTLLDTEEEAKARLANALKINIRAYVILVNGKPSLGLPTSEIAADTLQRVKDHFEQMPPAAQIAGTTQFGEKVEIQSKTISASRARATADEAAPYFWTPPPSKQYVVKPGDRGGKIAARNHISLADLFTANPGRNLNKLKAGDVLNVQKMPMLLTVRVQKTMTKEEPVIAHVPASEAGLERVTYLITYTNGQETHREPLNISIIEKPQTRSEI